MSVRHGPASRTLVISLTGEEKNHKEDVTMNMTSINPPHKLMEDYTCDKWDRKESYTHE